MRFSGFVSERKTFQPPLWRSCACVKQIIGIRSNPAEIQRGHGLKQVVPANRAKAMRQSKIVDRFSPTTRPASETVPAAGATAFSARTKWKAVTPGSKSPEVRDFLIERIRPSEVCPPFRYPQFRYPGPKRQILRLLGQAQKSAFVASRRRFVPCPERPVSKHQPTQNSYWSSPWGNNCAYLNAPG